MSKELKEASDYKLFFNTLALKNIKKLTGKEVNMCRDICLFIEQHFRQLKNQKVDEVDFLARIEKLVDEWDDTRNIEDRMYATSVVKEFLKWALENKRLIEDSKSDKMLPDEDKCDSDKGEQVEGLAERLVNLSLSIAEQSGDTQRFLKAKRFVEDNLTRQPQKHFKAEPGGLSPGEYMHEWMEKDAVELDLPTEEIIGNLCRDNKLLHDRLKEQLQKVTRELAIDVLTDIIDLHAEEGTGWEPLFEKLKELGLEVVEE